MKCEMLLDNGMNSKGQRMMQAMLEAAPLVGVTPVVRPRANFLGDSNMLMVYGIGNPHITACMKAYTSTRRRAIGWDLGYFNRRAVRRSFAMRVTLDDPHPQRFLIDNGPKRWERDGSPLRDDYSPKGPIIVCGLGAKSRVQYGYHGTRWESTTIAKMRAKYPMSNIIYRPKIPRETLAGATNDWSSPIELLLKNASLVVVHHSNVAVDACIAGIPVLCEDGAAMSLYQGNHNPDEKQRRAFLEKLAWWQWRPEEALECWRFLIKVSNST